MEFLFHKGTFNMKKVFTVLALLVVVAASIFAAGTEYTNSTITLNAKVPTIAPEFKFFGSMSSEFTDAVEGDGVINNVGNPAEEDITAYFKLTQSNLARYKGEFNITFTATAFSATIDETKYETAVPHAFLGVIPIDTDVAAVTIDDTASGSGIYKATLAYKKVNPVVADTDIMGVNFKWTKNVDLPASDGYSATVNVKVESV